MSYRMTGCQLTPVSIGTESLLPITGHGLRWSPIVVTWPVNPRRQGAKPAGGRILRKARLRKKHYKEFVSAEFYGYVSQCDMVDSLPGSLRFVFEVSK